LLQVERNLPDDALAAEKVHRYRYRSSLCLRLRLELLESAAELSCPHGRLLLRRLRPPLPLVTHPGVYFPHQKQHQPDRDHRVERTVAIQPLVHRPKLDFVFL
jgi:hypothetical protein